MRMMPFPRGPYTLICLSGESSKCSFLFGGAYLEMRSNNMSCHKQAFNTLENAFSNDMCTTYIYRRRGKIPTVALLLLLKGLTSPSKSSSSSRFTTAHYGAIKQWDSRLLIPSVYLLSLFTSAEFVAVVVL